MEHEALQAVITVGERELDRLDGEIGRYDSALRRLLDLMEEKRKILEMTIAAMADLRAILSDAKSDRGDTDDTPVVISGPTP